MVPSNLPSWHDGVSKILLQTNNFKGLILRFHCKRKSTNHFYCVLGSSRPTLSQSLSRQANNQNNKPNPLPLQAACPTERTMCSMVGSTQEQVKTAEAQVAVIGKCLKIHSTEIISNHQKNSCSCTFFRKMLMDARDIWNTGIHTDPCPGWTPVPSQSWQWTERIEGYGIMIICQRCTRGFCIHACSKSSLSSSKHLRTEWTQ